MSSGMNSPVNVEAPPPPLPFSPPSPSQTFPQPRPEATSYSLQSPPPSELPPVPHPRAHTSDALSNPTPTSEPTPSGHLVSAMESSEGSGQVQPSTAGPNTPPNHPQQSSAVVGDSMDTTQDGQTTAPRPESTAGNPQPQTFEEQMMALTGSGSRDAETENAPSPAQPDLVRIDSDGDTIDTAVNAGSPDLNQANVSNPPTADGPSAVTPPPPSQSDDMQIPPPPDSNEIPPPPPEAVASSSGGKKKEHAYWAELEEDKSVPEGIELKDIESKGEEISCVDYKHWEEAFYPDLDDPEYQPAEKVRITWTIKGVRGTKDHPNWLKIMNTPSAYAGGYYWSLKFFPRGNNATAMSCYIQCSATPRKPDDENLAGRFTVRKGPPNAVLSDLEPASDIILEATPPKKEAEAEEKAGASASKESKEGTQERPETPQNVDNQAHDNDSDSDSGEEDESEEEKAAGDWRASAQIGLLIYNPEEPRVGHHQSSCHQFNKHNNDWGWTNFHGPWNEIHKRQPLQRKALLQNDTLVLEAYIRIFKDPTQFLWWHSSESEPIWDSLSLTGFRPMGTPAIKHSPEVAAITSWLLLAPVRRLIESIDIGAPRRNSQIKTMPITASLQAVLYLMREQKKSETYVNCIHVISFLQQLGEDATEPVTVWERIRRSLELEWAGTDCVKQLSDLFDGPACDRCGDDSNIISTGRSTALRVPVEEVEDIQEALDKSLGTVSHKWSLPKVLNVEMDRQKFDPVSRTWKLLLNRVRMNDELDLQQWVPGGTEGKFRLYGFIVHVGERTSGKFYAVLRPSGPGTKWLAFEDGDGNKVECLTRKEAFESFEGLDAEALVASTSAEDVAYLAMYVRADVIQDFLPGTMEPFDVPLWLKQIPEYRELLPNEAVPKDERPKEPTVDLEVYASENVLGRQGLIDVNTLLSITGSSNRMHRLTVPSDTTYSELRKKLALWQGIANVEQIRLWNIGLMPPANTIWTSISRIETVDESFDFYPSVRPIRLWMHVLKAEEDVQMFGYPESPEAKKLFDDKAPGDEPHEETAPDVDTIWQAALEGGEAGATATDVAMTEAPSDPTEGVRESVNGSVLETTQLGTGPLSTSQSPEMLDEALVLEQIMTSGQGAASADLTGPAVVRPEEQPEPQGTSVVPSEQLTVDVAAGAQASQASESEAPTQNLQIGEGSGDQSGDVEMSQEDDAAIAAIIAGDLEAMEAEFDDIVVPTEGDEVHITEETWATGEIVQNIPAAPTDSTQVHDVAAMDDVQPSTPDQEQENVPSPPAEEAAATTPDIHARLPAPHIYIFVQIFDPNSRTLTTLRSHLARSQEKIMDTVRKVLPWPTEQDVQMWERHGTFGALSIVPSRTFDDVDRMVDGTVIIAAKKLSEIEHSALQAAGKFTKPSALLRYLWMSKRKHPIHGRTGEITMSTFGEPYFKGMLHKGLRHGQGNAISDSGTKYEGSFLLGDRSGTGTMIHPNGDTYTGEWQKDESHGQGTFVQKRTGNKYVGNYKEGRRFGKGISYWEVADEEMKMCQICYGQEMDALFYDCGHVCACVECAKQVDCCPICRKSVVAVVKMYKT